MDVNGWLGGEGGVLLAAERNRNREPVPIKNRFQIIWSMRCLQSTHVYTAGNLQQRVMAERRKQSKGWLHFTKKDDNMLVVISVKLSFQVWMVSNIFKSLPGNMGLNSMNAMYTLPMLHNQATCSFPRANYNVRFGTFPPHRKSGIKKGMEKELGRQAEWIMVW